MTTHRLTASSPATRRTVGDLLTAHRAETATAHRASADTIEWCRSGRFAGDLLADTPTRPVPAAPAPADTAPIDTAPIDTADLAPVAPTPVVPTPADTADPAAADDTEAAEPVVRSRRGLRRVLSGVALAVVTAAAIATGVGVVVFKVGFATVLSPSMEPGLHPGDLLLTRAEPTADLEVGDVVVLPRPDAPGERYSHRVVAVRWSDGDPVVTTKGDNNTAADPQPLRITSDTVPVAFGHVPRVGGVALAGQRPWVRVALIVLVGLALFEALRRAILRRAA
ncbi:signal peptidase I [Actinokineospora bangkokensis]|uniref:Signal peptidase I n=1 Tax=Actinokineospora bangkokensis TaxID=1193682 RepID=A0A1Q9LPY5_9PSEU|nr:signal peptidase I [Actinokineospora bangkokensis]OLR94061.1 signal peptidase I [Actinokineospora bangkokensis]